MPILARVGRRSLKMRVAIALVYAALGIGAVTMLYPLLLMLSGSMRSDADFYRVSPLPEYLFDDDVLWAKYLESKYGLLTYAEAALHRPVGSWRNVRPPEIDAETRRRAELFEEYRATIPWPREWYTMGHAWVEKPIPRLIPGQNTRRFREAAREKYGDVERYSAAAGVRYPAWSYVGPPLMYFAERRFTFPDTAAYALYYDVKRTVALADRVVVNLDGAFWRFTSYRRELLDAIAPPPGPARDDWEDYVRNFLNLAYIRVAPSSAPGFTSFLSRRYPDVANLNRAWGTNYSRIDDVKLPEGSPANEREWVDYAQFIKDPRACPIDALSVYGPRQGFEDFLRSRYVVAEATHAALPIEAVDYSDFQRIRGALRWEFVRRNYLVVWDYIAGHGNGVRNTILFCALFVLAQLIVNPLAAYALSRYKPPSTYAILLFCMATMAFPAEVTMIPSFLLLKDFHLLVGSPGTELEFAL